MPGIIDGKYLSLPPYYYRQPHKVLRGLLTLIIAFQLMNARAQEWEFGLQGGASGYMGDLNPENPLAFNEWAAGAFVKYNFNHTWGVRANLAYANLFAYDGYSRFEQRQERNLGFFGAVKEAALLVDFNFFKWLPQRGRIVYTPYIFAGVGGVQFNPKWYDLTQPHRPVIPLKNYQTEDTLYRDFAISIPFGAGFKYNLRGAWSIGIELAYRLTLTDYLDDVSKNYTDLSFPSNPGNFPIGTQRGDGRPYDSFMTVGVTLSYTIFKGGCPEWQ